MWLSIQSDRGELVSTRLLVGLTALLTVTSICGDAAAGVNARLAVYLMRLEPHRDDAESFSKAAFGGAMQGVIAAPRPYHYVAGVLGGEAAWLKSQRIELDDKLTGLDTEQQTVHDYARLFLGPRFGPQGRGFFRPYVGFNIGLAFYSISTDVFVYEDPDHEEYITNNISSESNAVWGYDINAGLELNFRRKVFLDFGGRYIQNFEVEQQIGETGQMIKPKYIEFFVGIGIDFSMFNSVEPPEPDPNE